MVLFLHRDLNDIVEYLSADASRPSYLEDVKGVWERREPWYAECSNYEYFSRSAESVSMQATSKDFAHLLLNMTGRTAHLEKIKAKTFSAFISVTNKDVSQVEDILPEIVVGSDAIELRIDLLEEPGQKLPTRDFVARQIAAVRGTVGVPIVFTIRTRSQGGAFPDDALEHALDLYHLASRMGVEFLDLEIHQPEAFLQKVISRKGQSKIIASNHDPQGHLHWNDGSWVAHYNKALQLGDIIKLVGVARSQQDNADAQTFRTWAEQAHSTVPLIVLNMGTVGQLSRVQNTFLTPVTHPLLSLKAAPGQLSAKQIATTRGLIGAITPRELYLFGEPISASRSPTLHNSLFEQTGLPHHYSLFETNDVAELDGVLSNPSFGGGSVTIPLKLEILPYLDAVSHDARVIGAVNTIVVDHSRRNKSGLGHHRTGHNTDWRGIVHVLELAGAAIGNLASSPTAAAALATNSGPVTPASRKSGGSGGGGAAEEQDRDRDSDKSSNAGLVIGSGGTARAAAYALSRMGCRPVFVLARSKDKAAGIAEAFPASYGIVAIGSAEEARGIVPVVAVGTVPADREMYAGLRAEIEALLGSGEDDGDGEEGDEDNDNGARPQKRVLLDMAYKPRRTALMQLAEDHGWTTVEGLEALAGQGLYQVRMNGAG